MSVKVAIILAAGNGERMGGSKALLLIDGKTLVTAHIERALEAGCERVVVVARAEVAMRFGAIEHVTFVPVATAEQAESLAAGARKVGKRGDSRVLLTPVDAPPVALSTIEALFEAIAGDVEIATPVHGGKGGHPVACRAKVLNVYGKEHEGKLPSFRDVLAARESVRVRIEVNDPRVGIDLDTPEDVMAFTGEPPRFW